MEKMKTAKVSALFLAMIITFAPLVVYGQSEVTREHAKAVLARVGMDMMNAQLSGDNGAQAQQLYTAGEAAYFKGDYATAVKKLKQADKLVSGLPNDYGEIY
jgi:hypothetical protein